VSSPTITELAADRVCGSLEPVAQFHGAMPTGVTVSQSGRIFICYPKWGDDVAFTAAELRNGEPAAFPRDQSSLVSVQSVVVDPLDRLWILDTGSRMFQPTQYGGPKLVSVDLSTDKIIQTILFPEDVALPTTYLNDVRFDLRRGNRGMAFITDSSDQGPNGIIVVDLESGQSWRKLNDDPSTKAEDPRNFLPVVEGRPLMERKADGKTKPIKMGADGIAIDCSGDRLFYCPLISRRLYSVSVDALMDRSIEPDEVAATVMDHGDRGGASDGLESDSNGNIYSTNYEHNSIQRLTLEGQWETVVHDPRLLWPDTMSIAMDGYLYVTANQLHRQARFNAGQDLRQKPYSLFRVRIDQQPVLLR
jgi:sugar lactone lactonase YvrE